MLRRNYFFEPGEGAVIPSYGQGRKGGKAGRIRPQGNVGVRRYRSRWSGCLVLLLGTFLAVMNSGYADILIVQLLRLEQSETEGSQKYQALKFLGIGMGGMLLALQALIANKRD